MHSLGLDNKGSAEAGDFTLHNIPFGVITLLGQGAEVDASPRPATAIGTYAVDLRGLGRAGFLDGLPLFAGHRAVFEATSLNPFIALGRAAWHELRVALQALFAAPSAIPAAYEPAFYPLSTVRPVLPIVIGDYTDFYASKEHAINVGSLFRDPKNALMPNWVHLPVGYHGRASSVVVSGTPITRPHGQILNAEKIPEFAASRKLDIELEVAFIVGKDNALGAPISIAEADEHLFGVVLMNDWSARDIQQFEYVPLGPFLGKNFGTTISPWIVTMEALEPFRVPQPEQDPRPLPYLTSPTVSAPGDAYDIQLDVSFTPASQPGAAVPLAKSNLKYMYWSFGQQLAHHSVNGCNMRVGDLCGSGTISGPTPQELGSLLEMTGNGKVPFWGAQSFLADGDEVVIRGRCVRGDVSLGFGECRGRIAPAPAAQP